MYKLFTFDAAPSTTCPPSPSPPQPATNTKNETSRATHKAPTKIRNSALSQKSLVAKYMAQDPIAHELFEERAAILEFDAGLTRADAERQAFIQVMQAFRED